MSSLLLMSLFLAAGKIQGRMKEWDEWKWNFREAGPTGSGQHSSSTAWSRVTERGRLDSNLAQLPPPAPCSGRGVPVCQWDPLSSLATLGLLSLGGWGVKIRWSNIRLCCLLFSKNVCWWDYLVDLEAKVKGQPCPWLLIKHSQFNRQLLQNLSQLWVSLDIAHRRASSQR